MQFDKWFNKQSTLLKVILLILPVVGWIVECLVRLSIALEKQDVISIAVFVLFLLVGWGWFLGVLDLIYLIVKGHLFLAE